MERIRKEKLHPVRFEQKDRLSPECGDIPRLTYDDTTLPPPGKAVRAPAVREVNSTHQLVSRYVCIVCCRLPINTGSVSLR